MSIQEFGTFGSGLSNRSVTASATHLCFGYWQVDLREVSATELLGIARDVGELSVDSIDVARLLEARGFEIKDSSRNQDGSESFTLEAKDDDGRSAEGESARLPQPVEVELALDDDVILGYQNGNGGSTDAERLYVPQQLKVKLVPEDDGTMTSLFGSVAISLGNDRLNDEVIRDYQNSDGGSTDGERVRVQQRLKVELVPEDDGTMASLFEGVAISGVGNDRRACGRFRILRRTDRTLTPKRLLPWSCI